MLRTLAGPDFSSALKSEYSAQLQQGLEDPALQLGEAHRFLRNALVHYGVHPKVTARLDVGKPLVGVVEAYLDVESFEQLEQRTGRGLDVLAEVLRRATPNPRDGRLVR